MNAVILLEYTERQESMLSIATDEAIQMLENGWVVYRDRALDAVGWRSPRGLSGSDYVSESLDVPPITAVRDARLHGEIEDRPRTIPR